MLLYLLKSFASCFWKGAKRIGVGGAEGEKMPWGVYINGKAEPVPNVDRGGVGT